MMKPNSAFTRIAVAALVALNLAGCSNMDENQQRMVSGGAIGIAAGAVTTVVTGGCIACGMAIGGAVGTAGGYLVDKIDSNTKSSPAAPAGNYSGSNGSVPQGYPVGGSYGSQ